MKDNPEVTNLREKIASLKSAIDANEARERAQDQKDAAVRTTLEQTVADLRAQLADGEPGLTPEQGAAFAAQIDSIITTVNASPAPSPA